METTETLIGQATEEQVAQWKAKYNAVYTIKADGKICYVHKPDRKTLSYISTLQNNPVKMAECMLNNCWLGGCEDFKTDDELFFGTCQQLGGLVQIKRAELSKL